MDGDGLGVPQLVRVGDVDVLLVSVWDDTSTLYVAAAHDASYAGLSLDL